MPVPPEVILIRINSLKLNIGHSDNDLKRALIRKLNIPEHELIEYRIVKKSLDARKKDNITYVYSIDVIVRNEKRILGSRTNRDITVPERIIYRDPALVSPVDPDNISIRRPVIVGFGPAGMFCAYKLAHAGLKPVVIERGSDVDNRTASVETFWNTGSLNTESNVQFGEGGAGTFSDGKLNTMIHDNSGRISEVFRILIDNGADPSIAYVNKPHVGTDRLKSIVKSIRNDIIACRGEVRFNTRLDGIKSLNADLLQLFLSDGSVLETDNLVLAIGHSARDTFKMLLESGIQMEQKPFAVGVRVQHPQKLIGFSQYGSSYTRLPAADYKLTYKASDNRAVYSFCMCPGGFVVNASSEEGRLAVNGMSNSDRGEYSANSALVVSINPDDFGGDGPLAGIEFQRKLEEKAFIEGKGSVPVQLYADFKNNITDIVNNERVSGNMPNIKGKWREGNLHNILPQYICDDLTEAIEHFGGVIKGYNDDSTVLIGLESRTSSPVRIIRKDNLESISLKGMYPCGEGAGYAGGITSAAVDGIKVYEAIYSKLLNN